MKGLVTTYLNIRADCPAVNAPNLGYLSPGDEVEIVDEIMGDPVRENFVWYKLDNGTYVWSGGVKTQELVTGDVAEAPQYINYSFPTLDPTHIISHSTSTNIGNLPPERHKGLSLQGSVMHEDALASDVIEVPGPVAHNPNRLYKIGKGAGGICPAFVFDNKKRMMSIAFTVGKAHLVQINQKDLTIEKAVAVSPKKVNKIKFFLNPKSTFKDASGGAYFFVENTNSFILPTGENDILIFRRNEQDDLKLCKTIGLDSRINRRKRGADVLMSALPDWNNNKIYWFTTKEGKVGVVNTENTGQIELIQLKFEGEEERIQNSFSVAPEGAYILTGHRLHLLNLKQVGDNVSIETVWSAPYDRGDKKPKPGQLFRGSGTTPTISGDYVAICDNAAKYMHVCVYKRKRDLDPKGNQKVVARIPVFEEGEGACENSLIGYEGGWLIGNTFGYESPFAEGGDIHKENKKGSGMAKIDIQSAIQYGVRMDDSPFPWDVIHEGGNKTVDKKNPPESWYNKDIDVMSAPPKLSLGTGLVYIYSKQKIKGEIWWCIVGIDWQTGETKLRIPIGKPEERNLIGDMLNRDVRIFRWLRYDFFDNAWGTYSISLTEKAIVLGMFKGLMRIGDG